MRAAWAQVGGVLLLLSTLLGTSLADGALSEPALLLGAVGALMIAWGVARPAVPPNPAGAAPAVAARERRRTLSGRAVPRQRDPDAAGHTRSRAPSEAVPAV